jgi:hypothetical protein
MANDQVLKMKKVRELPPSRLQARGCWWWCVVISYNKNTVVMRKEYEKNIKKTITYGHLRL